PKLVSPKREKVCGTSRAFCATHLIELSDFHVSFTDSEVHLTSCSIEHGDENHGSSTQEESNFILGPEVPGPSRSSTDQDDNTWNLCLAETDYKLPAIKEEQKELEESDQTPDVVFPSAGIVKKEGGPPALQVSYEIPPVSSECSAGLSGNSSSDEELVNSTGEQTMTHNARMLQEQGGDGRQTDQAALPYDNQSAKGQKDRSFCHLCGKGFQYIASLMKHIKTHESCHNKAFFCAVCGKTFANTRSLRLHERIHTGIRDFACQECGKTFHRREHLIVHVRTHSGEKPYHCDVCGKAFSQSQNVTIHKRSHSGERPYHCDLCGKLFNTSSHLKAHMRYHSGEKPYSCDVCGKCFRQSGQVKRHRTTHTGERPYACHLFVARCKDLLRPKRDDFYSNFCDHQMCTIC
uniref:C2H2-type domain-containing protein n=1 Tax=Salarias fasciatus TaxID=181472 RepID=A0A672FCH0_SALFA